MHQEPLLYWSAYEYPPRKKSPDWFWAVAIVALAGAVAAILLKNFLFAVVVLIGAGLLTLYAIRHPRRVHFEIRERAFVIEQKMYPFTELEAFWIDTISSPTPKLLLQSKHLFTPLISIPLENVEPEDIHELLSACLREQELHESLAVRLLERVGF